MLKNSISEIFKDRGRREFFPQNDFLRGILRRTTPRGDFSREIQSIAIGTGKDRVSFRVSGPKHPSP